MRAIKLILLAIPLFALWILVLLITLKQRNEYLMAKSKGMDCYTSHREGLLGGTHVFHFDPHSKPVKSYPTWKDYWTRFGYYK